MEKSEPQNIALFGYLVYVSIRGWIIMGPKRGHILDDLSIMPRISVPCRGHVLDEGVGTEVFTARKSSLLVISPKPSSLHDAGRPASILKRDLTSWGCTRCSRLDIMRVGGCSAKP